MTVNIKLANIAQKLNKRADEILNEARSKSDGFEKILAMATARAIMEVQTAIIEVMKEE